MLLFQRYVAFLKASGGRPLTFAPKYTLEVTTGVNLTYTIRTTGRCYRVIGTRRSSSEHRDPIVQGSYAEKFLRGVK